MARTLNAADAVRARIAAAWLGASGRTRVGRFELRPGQRTVLAAVARALERYGGALVADPPGTGKTVIALALAARLGETPLVVAPSALRAQWLRAAADAAVAIRFVSFEALGRGTAAPGAPLVIVDEAHHARSPGTRRYAALAALCISAKALLLSATPVVNRPADRDALLALFLGARAGALDERAVADVVIQQGDDAVRPPVRHLKPLDAASDVPGLGDALVALPPPLPAADGRAATQLVRIALAMAWRSSLAALDAALCRREQRGTVIRDALAAGRWPDRATLRAWVVGDDATQLALPLDLERAVPAPRSGIETIDRHLVAIRAMRTTIADRIEADTTKRANALRALCNTHETSRVVCFAQYGATVRALWRALRHTPGVVAITGERVHAAAGRWTRDEVLHALGPRSGAVRRDDPRAIRLLLTTDLLAEGVELQGVGIVVHGDVPWTPARMEQRVGRTVRVGSRAREVLVTGFRAPSGARPLLQLAARLARKRAARATALAVPMQESEVARRLAAWAAHPSRGAVAAGVVAHIAGRRHGFVAVVEHGTPSQRSLIVGTWNGTRWHVSAKPRAVAQVLADAEGAAADGDPSCERSARKAVGRWTRAQRVHSSVGGEATQDAALWRRIRRRVDRALGDLAFTTRTASAHAWSLALRTLANTRNVGAHRRIATLDRATANDREFAGALVRLADEWRPAGAPEPASSHAERDSRPRLLALLLVSPTRARPASARRAAWTETAATR